MSNNIYILGYSGHAFVVIDSIYQLNLNIKGYFDKYKSNNNIFNLNYLGDETAINLVKEVGDDYIFPAVGDNYVREKIISSIKKYKLNETIIISPSASVSMYAEIKNSTFVGQRAIINSQAAVGTGCIINTGAIVEHDCTIGDYTHIAPGAVITGNVSVGSHSFIGANAVVNPGLKIGDNVIIGSGSVVIKNVPNNTKWVGNPARQL